MQRFKAIQNGSVVSANVDKDEGKNAWSIVSANRISTATGEWISNEKVNFHWCWLFSHIHIHNQWDSWPVSHDFLHTIRRIELIRPGSDTATCDSRNIIRRYCILPNQTTTPWVPIETARNYSRHRITIATPQTTKQQKIRVILCYPLDLTRDPNVLKPI